MWQEICQVKTVIVVVVRYSCQHIGQPLPGIYICSSTASKQRVHNCSILCRIMITTKHVIFSPKSQGADCIFHEVVIYLISAIKVIPGQSVEQRICIGYSMAH